MSVVVSINDKNKIYMASDSMASDDETFRYTVTPKIYKRDGFLIGIAGSVALVQFLMESWKKPKDVFELRNILIALAKATGCMNVVNDGDCSTQYIPATFLVGHRRKIYEITVNFNVIEYEENYNAIGSGKNFALGALCATEKLDLTPKQRVNMAVEVSSRFCLTVGGKIHYEEM